MNPPGDVARVEVLVPVVPAVAFEVFTVEINQWWRGGVRFRPGGGRTGVPRFEPGVGGRLFEQFEDEVDLVVGRAGRTWDTALRCRRMRSPLAEAQDQKRQEAESRLTAEARIRLSLRLGDEALSLFRQLHPGTSLAAARRHFERQRQQGRRPSRCAAAP